jgi:oligopeptide transport system permease protein
LTRFLLRRLLWFGITIFTVMTVSFFLMRAVKGGPFDQERNLDPNIQANIEAKYHLDWPLWKQYLQYVGPFDLDDESERRFGGVLTGDFGPSFRYRDFTVNDIIAQSLPISALLGIVSMMWALALGVSTGIASALKRGSGLDLAMRLAATGGIALPNFVIAGFLIILFVFLIPLFPVAGWGRIQHMLLPGFCLGLVFAAYISRLTRTGMLEALSQDYIRTAYAKGLAPRTVILRHALKGGLLPVVSYLGPATAGIMTGSLVIERIFFIPGMGSHFINSASNRDYTLAMGVTILYTVLVYALNTVVDLAYTLLDPRISLEDG